MLYNVYSVRDSKVGFGNPFVDVGHASAQRGFFYAYANATNIVNFSPADFSLYYIGTFDTDTGALEKIAPTFVCCATDFIGKELDNAQAVSLS